ncbi:SRPBCC family protein [Novosphingobium panipatense]|uniref:Polyketide cyclase / dehydrase and lipid transport n=1 Tax=Novosphingobium panipatense TaxID=428991 RepID=A0ABY1QVC8_9SPHN|nr:SRPBCC family protein [Novosphingobium panipatense]SMP81866.1 Polyketide cyclase / dehydrase and lipid transport [Novosphingobium panipatense]
MTDAGDDAPLSTKKDGHSSQDAASLGLEARGGDLLARSVTINRPKAELYRFWRDFSNLPKIMDNIVRIDVIDQQTSHWVVKGPGGKEVEWDATITQDLPDEAIAWASKDASDISNSGRIEFRDAGLRGTVVTATILYDAPAGLIGKAIAKLSQREPGIQARRDLRRFKQLMETGEIATNARTRKQHEEEMA